MANKSTRGKQPEHQDGERNKNRAERPVRANEAPRNEALDEQKDSDQQEGYSTKVKYYSRGHQGGYRGL